MFGDELKVMETNENSVEIDLNDRSFEHEDNIIVTVISKGNNAKVSEDYTLKKLSRGDKERIKTLYSEIAGQTAEKTALNKLVIAGFYEKNNLLVDANTAFLEAIRLAPDVPAYNEVYNDFLLRNGMKVLPKK